MPPSPAAPPSPDPPSRGQTLPSLRFSSLHLRLVAIPVLVLCLGIAVILAVLVHQARLRVATEQHASVALAERLVDETMGNLRDPAQMLQTLARSLPTPRHVRLFLLPYQDQEAALYRRQAAAAEGVSPGWFRRLLAPAAWEKWRDLLFDGERIGRLLILSDPVDEIDELWEDFQLLVGLFLGLGAVFIALMLWVVRQALSPLQRLGAGLDSLERGDFSASLPVPPVAELQPVSAKFNLLARSLQQARDDNRLLIEKLQSVQDSERQELARDLHDELGPWLFGIKAQAARIIRHPQALPEEVSASARTIQGLTDDIQRLNRRLLSRLRPVSLQELGLAEAVRQLVVDWRIRHPDMEWILHFSWPEAEPPEKTGLAIYRLIQECLTNAARHSAARQVVVDVDSGPGDSLDIPAALWQPAAGEILAYVTVRDDGRGVPAKPPAGFGLLGLRERVLSLGGRVLIGNAGEGGLAVAAVIPLEVPPP